jgi:hypothetical protein
VLAVACLAATFLAIAASVVAGVRLYR